MRHSLQSAIATGLLVLCAFVVPGSGSAQGLQPAPGSFLVATRGQQGFFSATVILLIACDSDGAFGLVINRPTKISLAKLLPEVHGLGGDRLYLGGPVALDQLTLLIRSPTPPSGTLHVVGDVYASGSLKTLRSVAGKHAVQARFRGYAGYAGWGPGQLDSELAQGAWTVVPADADDVFTTAPVKLWDQLVRQGDVRLVDTTGLGPHWYGADPNIARWAL